MKSALTVVLFRLFTIGVCVDGNEESVSVAEGDSVTLKSGVTEIQTDDEIEWRFSGSKIASISRDSSEISLWVKADVSFRDRLQLDNQTGDLKIRNIRTTDSGEYKLLISSPRGSPPEIIFTVKVVSAAAVKSVLALEGYSVTLYTDLTEIQREDVIRWRFEQQKSPVAEINRAAGIFNTSDGADGRFRGRLKLDQTGSLTITNTKTTDSGLYEVEISSTSSRHTTHHTQSFSVTVSAVPESGWSSAAAAWILVGGGVVGVLLGAAVAGVIYYCYKRFRDSGWSSAAVARIGVVVGVLLGAAVAVVIYYCDKRSRAVPDSGWSSAAAAWIVVGVLLLAAAAVAVVIYYCYKRSRDSDELRKNESQLPDYSPDEDELSLSDYSPDEEELRKNESQL